MVIHVFPRSNEIVADGSFASQKRRASERLMTATWRLGESRW
jgi:hypothetical protein